MISETVNLWENGAITLPKAWRDRYRTKHFIAKENKKGNLEIIPIVDAQYVEEENGDFSLLFPTGMSADELLKKLK